MRYYLFYAVIIPNQGVDGTDRVSERIFPFSEKKVKTEAVAIEKAVEFQKQETLICASLDRTFVMGSLIEEERGKVRELKIENNLNEAVSEVLPPKQELPLERCPNCDALLLTHGGLHARCLNCHT